jgi:hypothetical protein
MATSHNVRPSSSFVLRTEALACGSFQQGSRLINTAKIFTLKPCPAARRSDSITNPAVAVSLFNRAAQRKQALRDAISTNNESQIKELGRNLVSFEVPAIPHNQR